MRILAVETATPLASAAVVDASGVLGEAILRAPMRHLEWLLPQVDEMLRGLDLRPREIEGIAVSVGPGGFTGLRVGIATAAAWARAAGIPLLGVGTLDALAVVAGVEGLVLPVLDAHRGEVAAGLYRVAPGGVPGCLLAPVVAPPAAVAAEAAAALRLERAEDGGVDDPGGPGPAHPRAPGRPIPGAPVLVLGDGLGRHGAVLLGGLGARARRGGPHLHPRAAAVGLLALPRLERGERDDPAGLVPVYGRRPALRPWQETPGGGGNRQ